jgi:hypothetical protein
MRTHRLPQFCEGPVGGKDVSPAGRPRFAGQRPLAAGLACVLVLAGALWAVAAGGRDFAGFFKLNNINNTADPVTLTLTMRVFNYSGSDVTNATITLLGSVVPNQSYGRFVGVAIATGQSVTLSSRFSIPQREYQLWQKGQSPNMMAQFTDSAGNPARCKIELAPGPVVGGK